MILQGSCLERDRKYSEDKTYPSARPHWPGREEIAANKRPLPNCSSTCGSSLRSCWRFSIFLLTWLLFFASSVAAVSVSWSTFKHYESKEVTIGTTFVYLFLFWPFQIMQTKFITVSFRPNIRLQNLPFQKIDVFCNQTTFIQVKNAMRYTIHCSWYLTR